MAAGPRPRSGGAVVVERLLAHGIDRLFCVPGESFLAVLDAAYDVQDRLQVIGCRHESGAAFMAAACAELRGRPQACFVTRGPGATNASIALHVAQQASVPLVLFVGQVPCGLLGREAFQELDYTSFCAPLAKSVEQVSAVDELAAACDRAFARAMDRRPGPTVVVLPEDVTSSVTTAAVGAPPPAPPVATPDPAAMARLLELLGAAQRPLLLFGGSLVDDAAAAAMARFAARNRVPVMTPFRRQDCFDNDHDCYAGYLGYSAHPAAFTLAARADCVVVIGGRLDEPTTQAYTLFREAPPRLVHVFPEAAALTRNYAPDLAIVAGTAATAAALAEATLPASPGRAAWCAELHRAWRDAALPSVESGLDPAQAMATLNESLPVDAIITSDAGNFSFWPQRGRRYRRPGRLLAPINGAMGYGVPAAIGAALACPERLVVGCVGDGGMLMTGMELATAARYGARPLILVFNNERYGTIEMHQDRRYPGRRIATGLTNPDFAALARSFGLFGARADDNDSFAVALADAFAADCAGVIELVLSAQ